MIGYFCISSPAVANGVVYIGSDTPDNTVYALNAATGAKLWTYLTGGAVWSSPAVANGVVYVGSNDDHVYALDATTGAKLWSYPDNVLLSSPTVANGVFYACSYQDNGNPNPPSHLYAFHLPGH
jgi:outer membrane protein assembly factor BamB